MKTNPTKIIAHRGFSACHLDNTWGSIRAAQTAGAECCEIDLMISADNEVIISHDYFSGKRIIAKMQSREVYQQLADSPRFEELLNWCEIHQMGLLLEVKDAQIIDRLSKILKNRDPELYTIGSFNAPFLKAFKAVRPEFATSLMLGTVFDPNEMVFLAKRYHCEVVHPCWESRAPYPHSLLSRETIIRIYEAGLKVILWHEEREDELEHLLNLGVDGICTNEPKRLKRMRDENRL
jgi:glycerophosphoryl diester phosphodiesterase